MVRIVCDWDGWVCAGQHLAIFPATVAGCACSDVAVALCSRDRSISRPEDDFAVLSRGPVVVELQPVCMDHVLYGSCHQNNANVFSFAL